MKSNYRLVWYQHFHKAAGTTIVDLAKKNSEVFWPIHKNGNPMDEHSHTIELWNYPKRELEKFIDTCEESGVTFVSTEWGIPSMEVLSNDPRVVTMTCLREPLSRFTSNFYYDLYNGFTSQRTLEDYVDTRNRIFTMFNYYTRVLSGQNNNSKTIESVDQPQFLKARKILDQFDCCMILENGLIELKNVLGWDIFPLQLNRSKLSVRQALSMIVRLKWKLLSYRLLYPKTNPDNTFKHYFVDENVWDIKLYNEKKKERLIENL